MDQVNGLPAHILIVHFVVVGVPLAALLTVLSAVWPAARRRLGVVTPVVALLALASVPLATNAGEWLMRHVSVNDLVRRHTQLGDELLPWVIGLFVVAVAAWAVPWWTGRAARAGAPTTGSTDGSTDGSAETTGAAGSAPVAVRTRTTPAPARPSVLTSLAVRVVLGVLAVGFAAVSVVQVVRIGESGSTAAWKDGSVCKVEVVDNACPDGQVVQG
ncbi:hypothetical protein [Nakamurella endophytica]|uniref:Uncharacterized protein n=1 Tax=Nakamurella endophytica TaxID=1748367 RepID=A0A917TEE1_9ACTN|nr:hypothetical protein [Nakamurella endophytica]GGM17588.1 hypothetical protein GCM10011594_42110 [Nakamurella endophytica]